ncbi:MAG TPA: RtcB family protein, partial [Nitrososphaerales archaeon]|nr:RtcB family protein [Nitrososphaerales archaeon]
YKQGMQVPAKLYASKKLLEGMDSGVIEQVTNVACLPGIVRQAYAMADAHWGYGFPIGGVAAFELENGVISPGGIGFDINCLHPSSRVVDENGVSRPIGTIDPGRHGFVTFDEGDRRGVGSRAVAKQMRQEAESILVIRTKTGRVIKATRDHPLRTRRGMVPAGSISADDSLLVSGAEGVPYSEPPHTKVVDQSDIEAAMSKMGIGDEGNAKSQILAELRSRSLDRIELQDPKMTHLLKILGMVFGDGTIPEVEKGQYVTFYGKGYDLEEVASDLLALGFASHPYQRSRHHKITTAYGLSEFDFVEESLQASSTSLAVLLVSLGAPYGKKTNQEYRLPEWLMGAEPWQKKVFLASFFGAEMSKPITTNGYDFQMPTFSASKLEVLSGNVVSLLQDFRAILADLGVETSEPALVEGYAYDGVDGRTLGHRIGVLSHTSNLMKFFGSIGYLYNRDKARLASLATLYLAVNQGIRDQRNRVRSEAVRLYSTGVPASAIIQSLESPVAGASFIRHSIWSTKGPARVWRSAKFEDFARANEEGDSGLAYDGVESIESVPYEGPVYDVTIDNPSHNFLAEGIVVSNCGMRLIRTNLRYSEVKPKVKELVDLMFRLVPAGVGVKGFLRVSESQFDEIMTYGVKWCAENGQAWEDDPSHVEEGGFIKGADPSKVSRQARSRGIDQLGTLGSGNHYLEVQVVDPSRFFDPGLAKNFGIVHDDQVLVMVHCGSRGFGHQVGSDYLRVFDGAMRKYGITVRDRELACAPYSSKEGRDYYGAMVCAANMAFTNRQIIVQQVRDAFSKVFHRDAESLDMHLIYDVCHNIAKVERHTYDKKTADLLVHRKGATRSFGPGHKDVPAPYRDVGQPVIIGGSMETGSYLLVGTQKAMEDTFGSTAHGSGRTMSRTAAKREVRGAELQRSMMARGIYVKAATMDGLAEEAGMAYKDISEVVETMDAAGISKKVVALRPVGNIKG